MLGIWPSCYAAFRDSCLPYQRACFLFWIHFPGNVLFRRQYWMIRIFRSLPPMWETQVEFWHLASARASPHYWRYLKSDLVDGRSLYLLPLPYPAFFFFSSLSQFQINLYKMCHSKTSFLGNSVIAHFPEGSNALLRLSMPALGGPLPSTQRCSDPLV